jgi:Tfp pilus assembly protein PilE
MDRDFLTAGALSGGSPPCPELFVQELYSWRVIIAAFMSKTVQGEQRRALLIEGLTLVEVMVGMLISAICLGTALQAYFGAVSMRSKSQQINTAIAQMEADAETIRQLSKECLNPPDLKSLDCKKRTDLDKFCKGNYAQVLMDKVVEQDVASASASSSTHELATKISMESSSQTSQNSNLSTPKVFIFPPSATLSQDEQLVRKMDIMSEAPNVLKVFYTLTRSSPSNSEEGTAKEEKRITLAQLSLTVMPNAALLCP